MFHDNELDASEVQKFHNAYNKMADVIQESLTSYLWMYDEIQTDFYKDGHDIHSIVLMLLLDFSEAIDGVVVLVRAGSAKNCNSLMRTAFEIQLQLRFLLEERNKYEQRCLAYEYFNHRYFLKIAEKCDPDSQQGKQLRKETMGHFCEGIFDLKDRDAKHDTKVYKDKMDSQRYATIKQEISDMKQKSKSTKSKTTIDNWFSLWNGPRSVKELAYHLKWGPLYEIYYRKWSSTSHGASALRRILGASQDRIDLNPIRSPVGLPAVSVDASRQVHLLIEFLLTTLVPRCREHVMNRYANIVKPGIAFIEKIEGLSEVT